MSCAPSPAGFTAPSRWGAGACPPARWSIRKSAAKIPKDFCEAANKASDGLADFGQGGEGCGTGIMHGDHGKTSSSFNNKDVPRFAPNFSVFVLPPDAVCLYSEDRKFFLYGELYCKLAAAIGPGGT